MTGEFGRVKSRAEIDARARAVRLALERDARTLGGVPLRLVALQLAVTELWRRVAGWWPEAPARPLGSQIDAPRRAGAPPRPQPPS
jgi:hypothetical protein